MTPCRRPRYRVPWLLVLLLAGLFGSAQADELLIYLDLDASAATGCSVTTTEGPFDGVEQVLVTRHQDTQVTAVARQACADPTTDTFGPEIPVSGAGWPVGLGLGTSGSDVVETFVPVGDLGPLQGAIRLAFATRDAAGVDADAVLGPNAGGLLLQALATQSTVSIPSLDRLSLMLLAILLGAVGLRGLRRHQGLRSFVLVVVLGGSLVGLVWAAITIDGDPSDWTGIAPLSTDAVGDGGGSDLVAVFGRTEGGQVSFRADVFGVNDAPVLSPDSFTPSFIEGGAAVAIADTITVTDPDDAQLASATVTITNPQDGASEILAADTTGTAIVAAYVAPVLTLSGSDSLANYQAVLRSVTYENTLAAPTLSPDRSITLVVSDGALDSNIATATTAIVHINVAPSFTAGADQTVLEDAGLQTVVGWATNMDDGDATIVQTLTFNLSNDNNALFSQQPAIDPTTGTLTYRPADNANGTATVTVTLSDDGGTASGGSDTSAPETFSISVTAVNDAPSFTAGADQAVLEDTGAQTVSGWATNITAGPPDEAGQTLSFNVSNDNNALFSAQPSIDPAGTLTYTPAPNASGSAIVTVTLSDDGGTADGGVDTSAAQTFTISVTAANDPPIANAQSVGTDEDTAVSITLTGSDPEGSALAFTLVTAPSNGSLGAITPLTSTSASVTYTPNLNYSGPDSFSFTVFDGGLTSAAATVSITVNPVNDAPVAANHSFDTVGNTLLEAGLVPASTVPKVSVSGRLFDNATDVDSAVPADLVASLVLPVTAGALVTVNSDGTFAYAPPPGRSVSDTFTYRLCNVGDAVHCSTGVVTVNFVDMVWYVRNDAPVGGVGRSADPFDTLAEAEAAAGAGQTIFVHTGNATDTGQNAGITLLDNQRLIGQGVALSVPGGVNGNPGPTVLLAAGVKPLIGNTTGDTVTLAQGNTVAGLGTGNTPPANTAFRHGGVGGAGNLTITGVSVSGTGGIIDIQNGATLAVNFDNLVSSSSAGPAAINLVGVSGSLSVSNPGPGLDTSLSSAAGGISVQGSGGAVVSFGETAVGSSGTGVDLGGSLANPGAGFSFAALTIATTNSRGLWANNSGTIAVTGSGNSISTGSGIAVEIANTTIGAAGVTLESLSVSGAASGIVLTNTGSGPFTVTGGGASDPTNNTRGRTTALAGGGATTLGSGGTIGNTTGDAVRLSSAQNVTLMNLVLSNDGGGSRDGISASGVVNLTLDNTRITGFSDNGILGGNVTGFSLQHSELESNAKSADSIANDEANIRFDNLFGSASLGNSLIRDVLENNILISSCEAGNCGGASLDIAVTNVSIRDTSSVAGGNDGVLIRSFNDANVTLSVSNSELLGNRANGIQHNTNDRSQGGTSVVSSTAARNAVAFNVAHQGAEVTHSSTFTGNTVNQVNGTPANTGNALNLFLAGASTALSLLDNTSDGNVIGNPAIADSGSEVGDGINLFASGAGTLTALANGNTVRSVKIGSGMSALSSTHTGEINVTLRNNDFDTRPSTSFPLSGLFLNAGAVASDAGVLCADISGNDAFIGGDPGSFLSGVVLQTSGGNPGTPTLELVGYGGADNNAAAIEAFLDTTATTVQDPSFAFIDPDTLVTARAAPCALP